MSKELPPPLTSKSSREDMWKEIRAMVAEIDSQQAEICEWKAIAERAKKERDVAAGELGMAEYQLLLIRAVLAKRITVRSTDG